MGLFGGSDAPEYHAPEPYKKQAPFLNQGWNEAQRLYNLFQGSPSYQGNLYSPANPLQQGGWWGLANYGAGQGSDLANAAGGASLANLGQGAQFGQQANDIYGRAQMDPTQTQIANAGSFANNPYLNSQIDAASRDVVRNLQENDLNNLNQEAAMSGNTDSSRAGAQAAILQRGAADRIGDIAAQMRGSAYQSGLNQAQNNWQQGLSAQLGANQQTGNAFSQGVQGAQGAFGLGTGAAGALTTAGAGFQNDEQQALNEAYQRWAMQDQRPSDLLNRYWGVASTGWGGGGGGGFAPQAGGGLAGGLQGALGGAATGAAIGSAVPGIGTMAGALGGGVLGGLAGFM